MITLLELFGGIGAPRAALLDLGVPFSVLDYVEINPTAVKAYNALYGESYSPTDIRTWKKRSLRGKVDILIHGSPCQDFSIGGNQSGGEAGTNTRSSLLWVSANIVKNLMPSVVVWENVSNVLSKKHKPTLKKYWEYLETLGYRNQTFLINSVECGACQSRLRCFVISNRIGGTVRLKKPKGQHPCLKDICAAKVDSKYYIPREHFEWFLRHGKSPTQGKTGLIRAGTFYKYGSPYLRCSRARVYSLEGVSPTITTFVPPMVEFPEGIRELTPEECLRVQGFSEKQVDVLSGLGLKDSELYLLAGNTMSIETMKCVLGGVISLLEDL